MRETKYKSGNILKINNRIISDKLSILNNTFIIDSTNDHRLIISSNNQWLTSDCRLNASNNSIRLCFDEETISDTKTIAIGVNSGISQHTESIAIGYEAGFSNQQASSIAIGAFAGNFCQGLRSIAIGSNAGKTTQHDNTIILNANNTELNSIASLGTYISPIREAQSSTAYKSLYYDDINKEIVKGELPYNDWELIDKESHFTGVFVIKHTTITPSTENPTIIVTPRFSNINLYGLMATVNRQSDIQFTISITDHNGAYKDGNGASFVVISRGIVVLHGSFDGNLNKLNE